MSRVGGDPVRVLVVDDTAIFRKVIRDALADHPAIDVVGTAANGKIALEKIEQLKPDVLTLDLEMPELDGLGVLKALRERRSKITSIMVSAVTAEGAAATVQALQHGAADFVLKPSGQDFAKSTQLLKAALIPKVATCAPAGTATSPAVAAEELVVPLGQSRRQRLDKKPLVLGIGVSTGGPVALGTLMPGLPADFPVPVVIVQHMPKLFTKSLAKSLNENCALDVSEAEDGARLEVGRAYIAPGGYHLKVVCTGASRCLKVTEDPAERGSRPSVDYLFRSLAHEFGAAALAVVLTGMGDDGTLGSRLMRRQGAGIFVQDEASSAVYGMPRGPLVEGVADRVYSIDDMAGNIVNTVCTGLLR